MSKRITDTTTFQELEKEAYYAFIEWPLFLIRRIRQLEQHIAAANTNQEGEETIVKIQ